MDGNYVPRGALAIPAAAFRDNGVYGPLDYTIRDKQPESVLKNWWASTPFVHPSLCRLRRSSGCYTATLDQDPMYGPGRE